MSRMTKYLRQQAIFRKAVLNPSTGKPEMDLYGAPLFEPGRVVLCRREQVLKDVGSATGAIVKVSTRYYVDESCPVANGDVFDKRSVVAVEEYSGSQGRTVGYFAYVV